jgi:predicted SAM-dependent methyltransferase
MSTSIRSTISMILTRLNQPIGRYKFKKALEKAQEPLRIEVGAWNTRREGWISTDVHWRSQTYLDATRKWPVADNSVDYIYADNVVEHLTLEQNRFFFEESQRVLRPDGRIRLVTPDISALARLYLASPEDSRPLRDELLREGYSIHHQVDLLRFAFQDDGHHEGYLWDLGSLSDELLRAGLTGVSVHEAGSSLYQELSGLEARVGTPVANICIVVEAMKPPSILK